MAKKPLRAVGAKYLIDGLPGDNPKLMAQVLSDGRESLYLEFYHGFTLTESAASGRTYRKASRTVQRLHLYIWQAPRTPQERQANRDTLDLARRIRFERAQELLESLEGFRLRSNAAINLHAWMEAYERAYTKADIRQITQARRTFAAFLTSTPAYAHLAAHITPAQLTPAICQAYADHLTARSRGEGAHSTFARFKKMLRAATAADIFRRNPAQDISIRIDRTALRKDILSLDEIHRLVATPVPGENPDIRRAFIFCLYTGIRYCDVQALTYADVDRPNRLLRFDQAKTKGHSSASGVVIPLTDTHLTLIGEGPRTDRIFRLPSHTMCLKALRHWTARAGIDKHITWHCARHSFAVNILGGGANIKTLASLLGHASLSQTEKYTRAIDTLKQAAISTLPPLDL